MTDSPVSNPLSLSADDFHYFWGLTTMREAARWEKGAQLDDVPHYKLDQQSAIIADDAIMAGMIAEIRGREGFNNSFALGEALQLAAQITLETHEENPELSLLHKMQNALPIGNFAFRALHQIAEDGAVIDPNAGSFGALQSRYNRDFYNLMVKAGKTSFDYFRSCFALVLEGSNSTFAKNKPFVVDQDISVERPSQDYTEQSPAGKRKPGIV